jgi:hypothetical protein
MTGPNPAAGAEAVGSAVLLVLREHGWEVASQPARLRAMLSDVLAGAAQEHRAAVDALVVAAEEGVGRTLAAADGPARAALLAQLPATLTGWGLDLPRARWAVQTWDWALRHVDPARTDLPLAPSVPPVTSTPAPSGIGAAVRPAVSAPVAPAALPPTALPPQTPWPAVAAPNPAWPAGAPPGPVGPGAVRPRPGGSPRPSRLVLAAVLTVLVVAVGLVVGFAVTRHDDSGRGDAHTSPSQTTGSAGGSGRITSGPTTPDAGTVTIDAPVAADTTVSYVPAVYSGHWASAHLPAQVTGVWVVIVIDDYSEGLVDVRAEDGEIYWTPASNGDRAGLWIKWHAYNSDEGLASETATLSITLECNADYQCYGG